MIEQRYQIGRLKKLEDLVGTREENEDMPEELAEAIRPNGRSIVSRV
jgi:hypothetical protein